MYASYPPRCASIAVAIGDIGKFSVKPLCYSSEAHQSLCSRYISDRVYAQATIYFLCAILGLFTLTHLLSKLTPSRSGTGAGILRKPKAILRYLAYKCYKPSGANWLSPTAGQILLILFGILFFSSSFTPSGRTLADKMTAELTFL